MDKKRVLICGATGFIGRNLVESLSLNPQYQVIAVHFSRPPFDCANVEFVKADLTDRNQVSSLLKGVDVVVQAAASTSGSKESFSKPHLHICNNAVMNSLLLRAAHDAQVKHFVFLSCSVMYQSSEVALKEEDFDANQPMVEKYFGGGWTKVYLEKMCEFYSRLGSLKATVIRHSNIYGPHDKYDLERSHVFGATITKVMTAPLGGYITVWGTGVEERDLLYVSDLVDFVGACIEKQETSFELLNVASGTSISVDALVKKIITLSGKSLEMRYDPSGPTIKTKISLNADRALETFGWRPKISLDAGILKTLEYYREHVLKQNEGV